MNTVCTVSNTRKNTDRIADILGKSAGTLVPKIIQMPKRSPRSDQDVELHQPMTLPEEAEESALLARIQRWLDLGDSAIKGEGQSNQKRAA